MKSFKLRQKTTCIYCSEKQEYPVIDNIPFVLDVKQPLQHDHVGEIQRVQCDHCDEYFYLRFSKEENLVHMSNQPRRLYPE